MKKSLFYAAALATLSLALGGCNHEQSTAGAKLTLSKPSDVSIKQGTEEKLKISITRDHLTDPVTVTFDDLPKGVAVKDKDIKIPSADSSINVTIAADNDAPPVADHVAKVTASAPNGLKATESFKVTVKDKTK